MNRRNGPTLHRWALLLALLGAVSGGIAGAMQEQGTGSDGRSIPHRIVTIAPNAAEIICALGACDSIVGVSKFCVYPPELKSRPRIGGFFDADRERILALRPDLVVLRGRSESLERLCADHKIPIYLDETDTIIGIEKSVADLGRKLRRESQAAAVISKFQQRLAAVRERVSDKRPPRVFITVNRQADRLANILTTGKGTFLSEMMDLAGGANIFADLDMAYPQVNREAILVRRPEVIIEFLPGLELSDELREQLTDQWKALGPLPAVTNHRVFFITDSHALIPSPRYVQIIEKVSFLLHPEPDGGR